MDHIKLRNITWIRSSKEDLKGLPKRVQNEIGFALHQVQEGKNPFNAKPLKGFNENVLEIISDFNKSTFRAVYTITIGEDVYVLHVFQKKSKHGIKTPKKEIDLIKQRLIDAKEDAKKRKMLKNING